MPCPLDRLNLHRRARVTEVACPDGAAAPERVRQLADIGFVPGARVAVLARAWPGGDPLVVRVGESRFALRRAEAACVQVDPVAESA
jgi:ferrous iron transport protein A